MTFPRWIRTELGAIAVAASLLFAPVAHGAIVVPVGGSISLAGGAIDLGCTDMTVAGDLLLNSASITNGRNVTIQVGASPDGSLDGGSGSITLAGNWSNSGTFIPGTSSVNFVENAGCAASSAFSGNTTFNNLNLVSNAGKVYTFPPGSTQSIQQTLTIQGTLAHPVQIASGVPGSPGFINLAFAGTQNIAHVGVGDNWATGQPLAPLLTNEGGTGDSTGWFGALLLKLPIPALGAGSMALLAIMLAGFGIHFARRRVHADQGE